ncbi:9883_t:CDS:1, partial [Racocetra persica]
NFDDSGPQYDSAESIINHELLAQPHDDDYSREASPKPGLLSQNSSAILSQKENNNLFEVNK